MCVKDKKRASHRGPQCAKCAIDCITSDKINLHFRSAKGITCTCSSPGALLSIQVPHDGHGGDIIRPKVFEDYIRDNVASWFDWSQKNGLDVERMEDLILIDLITGCTLVTSWAAALGLPKFPWSKGPMRTG